MATKDPVEQFCRRWAQKRAKGTAKRYRAPLRDWRDWLADEHGLDLFETDEIVADPESPMSTNLVEDFLLEMSDDGYSESSVHNARSAISSFYGESGVDPDPAEEVDLGRGEWSVTTKKTRETKDPVVYLTPEEIEQMVESAPSPQIRNRLLIRLGYQLGCRLNELVTIRIEDIDRDSREVKLYTSKADEYRVVPYQPSLDNLLSLWIDTERDAVLTAHESPYLFPTQMSEHLSNPQARKIIKRAAEEGGLQETLYTDKAGNERHKISPHQLRHSFAVQCAKNGMSAPFLRDLLGHSDISVTQIYLELAEEDAVEHGKKYGPSI